MIGHISGLVVVDVDVVVDEDGDGDVAVVAGIWVRRPAE